MAFIYRNVNGTQLEKYIAILPGVQNEIDGKAEDIGARAEHNLQQADVRTGVAHIDILNAGNKNRDRYVVLVDDNANNKKPGANSAASIEFGREAYVDQNGREWGEMEGLAVLTRAANLPRSKHPKVRIPHVRQRPKRGKHGRFA